MEEIYYKKNLEDLTNRQLDIDYQNLFLENRLENYSEELEEHHEIIHDANPEDRLEPAESRNIIFNYIRDFLGTRQAKARRRLNGGRQGKKSKRRKSRKSRRVRKTKISKRRR
jgi:hypothetical protein